MGHPDYANMDRKEKEEQDAEVARVKEWIKKREAEKEGE